jgi:hypothetical protein
MATPCIDGRGGRRRMRGRLEVEHERQGQEAILFGRGYAAEKPPSLFYQEKKS